MTAAQHDDTEPHSPACAGCQILGLMQERDAYAATIAALGQMDPDAPLERASLYAFMQNNSNLTAVLARRDAATGTRVVRAFADSLTQRFTARLTDRPTLPARSLLASIRIQEALFLTDGLHPRPDVTVEVQRSPRADVDRVVTTKGPSRTGTVLERRAGGRLVVEWDDGLTSGCSDQVVTGAA